MFSCGLAFMALLGNARTLFFLKNLPLKTSELNIFEAEMAPTAWAAHPLSNLISVKGSGGCSTRHGPKVTGSILSVGTNASRNFCPSPPQKKRRNCCHVTRRCKKHFWGRISILFVIVRSALRSNQPG